MSTARTAGLTTPATEKYKNIINKNWRTEVEHSNPDFFIKHPRMTLENRAKVFAPFAALRGHGERLSQETGKLLRTSRVELSEEEAAVLSDKLLQVKRGMEVTVVYFEADSENGMDNADNMDKPGGMDKAGGNTGYDISLTGTVAEIDAVYRTIKINTGEECEKGEIVKTVKFDDLLDMSGPEIVGIDEFLGIEDGLPSEDYSE